MNIDYLPLANEVWGKVMFLHLSVILFREGGVCILGEGVGQTPSWILSDTVNERAVRILLEYILVVKYILKIY